MNPEPTRHRCPYCGQIDTDLDGLPPEKVTPDMCYSCRRLQYDDEYTSEFCRDGGDE